MKRRIRYNIYDQIDKNLIKVRKEVYYVGIIDWAYYKSMFLDMFPERMHQILDSYCDNTMNDSHIIYVERW